MLLNRSISYTFNWLNTLVLSCILAVIIVFILIFLQPFDSYSNDIPYKNLKLIGYGFCIIIPILILHVIENYWYIKNGKKWFLFQELIILIIGFFFITMLCHIYNTRIVNNLPLDTNYILAWMEDFGMPFIPIFMPLWVYLRFRFSQIIIKPITIKHQSKVSIIGNNKNEELSFLEIDFVMAKAQSNYVDIYYLQNDYLNKKMIRTTLSNLIKHIPSAQHIHRSYIVNPLKIKAISGNTRQGNITMTEISEDIPISPKHFLAVKTYLQNRP